MNGENGYTERITIKISPELKMALKEVMKERNVSDFIRGTIEEKVKKEKVKRYKGLMEKEKGDMNIIEAMEKKRILEAQIKELDILIQKLTEEETINILRERMNKIKKLVGGN